MVQGFPPFSVNNQNFSILEVGPLIVSRLALLSFPFNSSIGGSSLVVDAFSPPLLLKPRFLGCWWVSTVSSAFFVSASLLTMTLTDFFSFLSPLFCTGIRTSQKTRKV